MAEQYSVAIREIPSDERPRERLTRVGAGALSLSELLAIQIRMGAQGLSALGVADRLIHEFGGLRGVANASLHQLTKVHGIGPAKAVEILAAVELGRRLYALSPEEKPTIGGPNDVARLLMPEMRDLKQEHVKAILLDTKHGVIKIVNVSQGTIDSALIHPREVFRPAVEANSAAVIIAHNHPSGDPTPSKEDLQITARLVSAGQIVGIEVLDHVVLGSVSWISFKDKGLL